MGRPYTASIKLSLAFLAAVFAIQVYRAIVQPIGSGEAYLYDRFVRPTTRQVLAAELPDRDVLYGLLEKRSVGLFHVSPFSVRLPALLFGILYLWSIWRLAPLLGSEWRHLAAVLVGGAVPLFYEWFARADGTGAALSLLLCGVWLASARRQLNLAGICLGLSICASLSFAIPAAACVFGILVFQRRFSDWVDGVLIPASVVTVILLALPLSHAHAAKENTPALTAGQAAHLQSALQALRVSAGTNRIRIGASPAAEPVVNFYRAEYRATTWQRAIRDYSSEHFDYYLLSSADAEWAEQRHLTVGYRDTDFLVAQAGDAAR